MTLLQARTTKVVLSGALLLFGVVFWVPSDFASVVPVDNPSFEDLGGALTESCPGFNCHFRRGSIPDWTTPGDAGQLVPSISGQGHLFDTFAPNDGHTSAWSNGGTISQEVGPTVQEGLIYTLTVEIGHRNDIGFAGTADLLLSGPHHRQTIVAMGKPPVDGHWSTFTATFVGNSSNVGDHITIQLNSHGGQGNFDSVTLTAVPEPGTLLLFGSGVLLIGIIVRRKQLHAKARNIGLVDEA